MRIGIATDMHDTDYIYRLIVVIRNIKNQIIIYRHNAKISGMPRLGFVFTEAFRHLVKAQYLFFKTIDLTDSVLLGL